MTAFAPNENPVYLGQDIFMEVSKYLEPIDYSAVSRLFWKVAEERAESLLKETEDRCFGLPSSDWSSLVGKTKWKLRLGFSVLEGSRGFHEDETNTEIIQNLNNVNGRKRKRADEEDATIASISQLEPTLNPMSSRLLWNRASRVPLASTQSYFKGPNAMLPDGHHIAFFCTTSLQIIVVNADATTDNGNIVHVMDAKDAIPSASTAATDLRLFCSDGGHLMLYCSYGSLAGDETANEELSPPFDDNTTEECPSPPLKRTKTFETADLSSRNDDWCTVDDDTISANHEIPMEVDTAPRNGNAASYWVSVWKISSPDDAKHPKMEHKYLRRLDASDSILSPVQDMTFIPSTGTLVLLRYDALDDDEDEDDHSIADSNCDSDCWIQSLEISTGTCLAKKKISPFPAASVNTDLAIWNSQLSVPRDGNHVLLTLYCSPGDDSCPQATTTLFHCTMEKESLEIVDVFSSPSPSPSPTPTSSMPLENDGDHDNGDGDFDCDVFVQHAGPQILHFRSNPRHFPSDPMTVSSTGYVLSIDSDGRFIVPQKHPRGQDQDPTTAPRNRNHSNRWKLVHTSGDKHGENLHGLFEDPDENEIVLDEICLATGQKLRSISTGISRTDTGGNCYEQPQPQPQEHGHPQEQSQFSYFVDSVHPDKGNRHGGDSFVVISGSTSPSSNSSSASESNPFQGSTILLRILSKA